MFVLFKVRRRNTISFQPNFYFLLFSIVMIFHTAHKRILLEQNLSEFSTISVSGRG